MTKPRSTVELAILLLGEGHSLSEVSRRAGTARSTIREWVADPAHALRDRGDHDPGEICHLVSTAPAPEYAYLLGQYLGDGCLSQLGPRGVYRLRIATCDDYPDIRQRTIDSIMAVLPNNRVGLFQCVGCTEVSGYSKHMPCLFPQHGPGKKHERAIALEDWQLEIVHEHTHEFLAGLIHSDGCRSVNVIKKPNGKTYEYPRYFFTNVSEDILMLCADAFDRLGVEWKRNRWNCLSVAKKESVALLDTFIGPKT